MYGYTCGCVGVNIDVNVMVNNALFVVVYSIYSGSSGSRQEKDERTLARKPWCMCVYVCAGEGGCVCVDICVPLRPRLIDLVCVLVLHSYLYSNYLAINLSSSLLGLLKTIWRPISFTNTYVLFYI
jgi:hypothetical protein